MRAHSRVAAIVAALAIALPAGALTPGTDVIVPAAARGAGQAGSTWRTDLYVFNPSSATASLVLYWLVRDQPNPSPANAGFTLSPGQTLILPDVIQTTFGLLSAGGALRAVSDQPLVVTSRIFNSVGGATFGQGFAGIPRTAAVGAGGSTDIVGLSENAGFRTNVVLADASGSGSTLRLSLRSPAGAELAGRSYALGAFEPVLRPVSELGAGSFANATLHLEVTSGAVIAAASKIDNDPATGDPTTLEAWAAAGAGATVDGSYRLLLADSADYASGGRLTVSGGAANVLGGTYFNWDKLDGADPACPWLFLWGGALLPSVPVADFAGGVELISDYPGSGRLTYTVRFTIDDNLGLTGTVSAVGSSFPADQDGCNGAFPDLVLEGGKTAN